MWIMSHLHLKKELSAPDFTNPVSFPKIGSSIFPDERQKTIAGRTSAPATGYYCRSGTPPY
ncbi:hypothetical protein NA56DRAFT_641397 [Hyaloscypha hepaticicola]|uniref:Uncharacterized protein n=1 Tax=Hyaloscypha hepaticicola TaxID=2082293 RepID=A0A2J6QKF2_9HELO|nr:hypothetical protein NA56DRAFT_641397 [Hyaloscypha hepaticicola]